jgi:hypothetical protein
VVLFIDMAHVRKFEELAAQAEEIQAEADALNDDATEMCPNDAMAGLMREKAKGAESKAKQAFRNVPVVALWKTMFASGKIRGVCCLLFLRIIGIVLFLPVVVYRWSR